MSPAAPRLRFANQLRGIAALAVAASHLIGVYWVMPEVVAAATFSPRLPPAPFPAIFWLTAHPWFNLGPFGVGLFFLISGLVIPFSLEKHTRRTFLAARLLRIYPTYVAAFLLNMAALAAAAAWWGLPFTHAPATIAANAALIYDLVQIPSIDLVNWTLSVELKFYLLVILIAPIIRAGRLTALVATAAAILALDAAIAAGLGGGLEARPYTPTYTASSHALCLTYMLIGTAFHAHWRGLATTPALLAAVAALAALFVATWQLSVWHAQYPVVTANYAYALAVFALLYAARRHIPANPVLDAMAAISFPFYVLHSLLGYTLLKLLMLGAGLGYTPALAAALAGVAAAATALHLAIERPTTRLGRRLAPATPPVKPRELTST